MKYHRLNTLKQLNGIELSEAIRSIPADVTSLDLSANSLGSKAVFELILAFAEISANVNSLNLSGNLFSLIPSSELVLVLASIPDSVSSLNLSFNGLGNKLINELIQIVNALKKVSSLNLGRNALGEKSIADLILLFTAIPENVHALNLYGNYLSSKTGSELAQAIAKIPNSVSLLDLSKNGLGELVGTELAKVFAAIPASVRSVDLSGNDFYNLSEESIYSLGNSLKMIQTLYLSKKDVELMTSNQRTAFKTVLFQIPHIILVDMKKNALGGNDLEACHYFASQWGLTREAPTLKSQAAFFVKYNENANTKINQLPAELQVFLNNF